MEKIVTGIVVFLLLISTPIINAQENELEIYKNWQTADNIKVTHLIVTDIDNDNLDDMIYTFIENGTKQFLCVQNITNRTIYWQNELIIGAQGGAGNLKVVDIDNDSVKEVIVLNDDFHIYIFNGLNGTLEGKYTAADSNQMVIDDVDLDGEIELLIQEYVMYEGMARGKIVVYDGKTHNFEWETPPLLPFGAGQLLVDDVDNDGTKEILIETFEDGGYLTIYDGQTKSIEFNTTTNSGRLLLCEDLNQDSHKEIITSYWEWPTGEPLPKYNLKIYNGTTYNLEWTSMPLYNFGFLDAYLSDYNEDNITDIIIIASNGPDSSVFVFDGNNYSLISQWNYIGEISTITIEDIDGDNSSEIIIGTDQSGWTNDTRSNSGYLHIIDSATLEEKWVSSNIGIIKGLFVTNNLPSSNIVVHAGQSIIMYSTSNQEDTSIETPGFGFELIMLATIIVCIVYRKKRK